MDFFYPAAVGMPGVGSHSQLCLSSLGFVGEFKVAFHAQAY